MARRGLVADFQHCSGCHACEVACRQEHGFPRDRGGIVVHLQGPFPLGGDRWSYHFLPAPTELCDGCARRAREGVLPSCVSHCPTACLSWAPSRRAVAEALDGIRGGRRAAFFNK